MDEVHDVLINLVAAAIGAGFAWCIGYAVRRYRLWRTRQMWPFRGDRVTAVIATSTLPPDDTGCDAPPLEDPTVVAGTGGSLNLAKQGTGIGQVRALAAVVPSVVRAWRATVDVCNIVFSAHVGADLSGHLVLIGGPRTNATTKHFLCELMRNGQTRDGEPVPFSQQGPAISWQGTQYLATHDTDYGLVVRCPNHHEESNVVVILSGASTFGTEAAARWYVGDVRMKDKAAWRSTGRSMPYFAALVAIDINADGTVGKPRLVGGSAPVQLAS